MKRKLAWFGIFAIAAVFAALVYCTATGASASTIMAFMVALIMVPVVIHGMLLILKLNHRTDSDADETEDSDRTDS